MAASQVCVRSKVTLGHLSSLSNDDLGSRRCNATCVKSLCLQSKQSGVLGRRLKDSAGRCEASRSRRQVVTKAVQKVLEGKQANKGSSDGATSEVEFEWKGDAREVLLTGSFLNWEDKVPLESTGAGSFKCKVALPAGSHQFKFVVDGEWQHLSDLETVSDGAGGVNNQVVVKEPQAKPGAKKEAQESADSPESEGRAETQPSTPTPDQLQAIAVKAPPPGEKPEPIEKTIAKVTGEEKKAPEKKSSDEAEKPAAAKPAPKAAKKAEAPASAEEKPKPKAPPKAKAALAGEDADNGAPSADAAPKPKAKPAAKGKAGKKAGKAPAKPLNELMQEDVVPMLAETLEKENVTDVELVWENNELRGCFVNGGVPYCFWAFFPDGKLEGSRGFSITSHGYPPSTIEPFFVDERAQGMTPEMMVFWIRKRLFAQKSALPKLN